jgi:hypothetical protein
MQFGGDTCSRQEPGVLQIFLQEQIQGSNAYKGGRQARQMLGTGRRSIRRNIQPASRNDCFRRYREILQ